ncbi:MAG: transcriptional regulator, partial [Bacteroides sp.]|nr:transcriptional regulator [Bacteroides sp.]
MEKKWLFFLLFLAVTSTLSATKAIDSLLNKLDKTIAESGIYTRKREAHIQQLKNRAHPSTNPSVAQYDLNTMLYQEYKAFMCDSAIYYLSRNIDIATHMHDLDRVNESKLRLSYLLASCGMYKEAVDMVQSVDRKSLNHRFLKQYYSCYDHAYGELGYYTQDKMNAGYYWMISSAYKDSLYAILDPTSDEYLTMQETSFRDKDNYAEALRINDQRLADTQFGTPVYANVTFYRSLIFKRQGDHEQEKHYLILSAMSDIQSAITDHASLWTLAEILYEEGDVERAYRYIRFSWNETKFYNARLRSWQSSDILSLIDKTYQAMMERKNNQLEQYLLLITALMLLLLGALTYIYRQMKRLSVARNRLEEANDQLKSLNEELKEMNLCLQSTNLELSESNEIKEEYIARFIKLCSTYIDKLDAYRRMVNKKVSANQIPEL